MMNALESSSLRPYLLRALHEWCIDNGFTPYVAVQVDDTVQVPREYVKNGEIVLNVSYDATSALKLGNEFIEFKARFGGTAREILVPVGRVVAIYARENGQGMAFPSIAADAETEAAAAAAAAPADEAAPVVQLVAEDGDVTPEGAAAIEDEGGDPPKPPPGSAGGSRPALKRIK